jgi:CheY-like chemotaxis protein
LGLYIAKGIVEQHGGKLTADSDGLGLGTTFTMTLPIYNVPQDVWNNSQSQLVLGSGGGFGRHSSNSNSNSRERSTGSKMSQPPITECSLTECNLEQLEQLEENENEDNYDDGDDCDDELPLTELKILLVDDSNSNRKLLGRLLSMRGHKCDQAGDGHLGVKMIIKAEQESQEQHTHTNTKPYDIVFMDYEMPTMCGPDAVKEIRELDCDVFIIGLTGNIMAEDVGYFLDCGANAVFSKPFKVKEFENLVNESLERDSSTGRIVEKKSSGRLDLITLGLIQDCGDESSLGWGDNDNDNDNDNDTALSSSYDRDNTSSSTNLHNNNMSSLLTTTPPSSPPPSSPPSS